MLLLGAHGILGVAVVVRAADAVAEVLIGIGVELCILLPITVLAMRRLHAGALVWLAIPLEWLFLILDPLLYTSDPSSSANDGGERGTSAIRRGTTTCLCGAPVQKAIRRPMPN